MQKKEVYQQVNSFINLKINQLQGLLNDVCLSTSEDSKSSAGDKHETSTSMAQLEQEKLSKQIAEFLFQKETLQKINPTTLHHKIDVGSLVNTDKGWFYFSIGLGNVKWENQSVFCLSINSPLGQLLKGKSINDQVSFNGNVTKILNVI